MIQECIINNNLISIIVPVYNVEKYLKRCVDSIINQTYKNIEIVLIDDGSTDNSGSICDEYAALDNRIKVYHIQNGGVSVARNYGILQSNGQFIGFVDSDDWIDEDMYQILFDSIIKENYDIAICGYKEIYEDKILVINDDYKILNNEQAMVLNINNQIVNAVWNKLYKKNIVKDIVFPIGITVGEDIFFTIRALEKSYHSINVSFSKYNYTMNRIESAMSKRFKIKSIDDIIYVLLDRMSFLEEKKYFYMYKLCLNDYINTLIYYHCKIDDKNIKDLISQNLKIEKSKWFLIKNKTKIKLILFKYFYFVLKLFYK